MALAVTPDVTSSPRQDHSTTATARRQARRGTSEALSMEWCDEKRGQQTQRLPESCQRAGV